VLRSVLAPNASPLTLDGTRTYIVGRERAVVIDPGSPDPTHLDAVSEALGDGVLVAVAVTHDHPDHVGGADELADRHGADVRMAARQTLAEGDRLATDAGDLVALATPGHTRDHHALHWPDEAAVFCGDLMMGGQATALVAPPEGRLGPYLASLRRIGALAPAVIYPAHGPPFQDPADALDRYARHRSDRLEQVVRALGAGARDSEALVDAVYGDAIDRSLRPAAMAALKAYLEHLQGQGRIRRLGQGWETT
jgi:glyoxylase-like metal-dependent hydrolase (beta-lactamase superfamily II)